MPTACQARAWPAINLQRVDFEQEIILGVLVM
jgi:hypothetical protein